MQMRNVSSLDLNVVDPDVSYNMNVLKLLIAKTVGEFNCVAIGELDVKLLVGECHRDLKKINHREVREGTLQEPR